MKHPLTALALTFGSAYFGAVFGTTFAYMKEDERRRARREHIAHGGTVKLTPKGRAVAEMLLAQKREAEKKGPGSVSV